MEIRCLLTLATDFFINPVVQSAVGCISRETEGCAPKTRYCAGVRNREANETGVPSQRQVSEKSGKMVTC